VLDSGSPDGMEANLVALRRGLGEAGFTEAKTSPSNIAGRVARAIKALADELVRKPVAVIVATRSSAPGLLRALLWVPAALYCAPPSRWADWCAKSVHPTADDGPPWRDNGSTGDGTSDGHGPACGDAACMVDAPRADDCARFHRAQRHEACRQR
jgi:hypothetical protein